MATPLPTTRIVIQLSVEEEQRAKAAVLFIWAVWWAVAAYYAGPKALIAASFPIVLLAGLERFLGLQIWTWTITFTHESLHLLVFRFARIPARLDESKRRVVSTNVPKRIWLCSAALPLVFFVLTLPALIALKRWEAIPFLWGLWGTASGRDLAWIVRLLRAPDGRVTYPHGDQALMLEMRA